MFIELAKFDQDDSKINLCYDTLESKEVTCCVYRVVRTSESVTCACVWGVCVITTVPIILNTYMYVHKLYINMTS